MDTTNSVCPNFNDCPNFFKARIRGLKLHARLWPSTDQPFIWLVPNYISFLGLWPFVAVGVCGGHFQPQNP